MGNYDSKTMDMSGDPRHQRRKSNETEEHSRETFSTEEKILYGAGGAAAAVAAVAGLTYLFLKSAKSEEFVENKRYFGEFDCTNCGRKWPSAYAWKNKYQKCKRCHMKVLPSTLGPLKYDGDKHQEHPDKLCEMCKELGYPCKYFKEN